MTLTLVPRLPTAVLSASTMVQAALSLTCGLILQTVTRGRQVMKRLSYLAHPGIINLAPTNRTPANLAPTVPPLREVAAARR